MFSKELSNSDTRFNEPIIVFLRLMITLPKYVKTYLGNAVWPLSPQSPLKAHNSEVGLFKIISILLSRRWC